MKPLASSYGAILADPPWTFKVRSEKGDGRSARNHYGLMSLPDIKALPVASWAAPDACLFLWATDPMLPQALDVMQAWGFLHKTTAFHWAKQNKSGAGFFTGLGYWTRANVEMCLLGTRTPKYVFDAMDVHFDLDVASPGADVVPWIPASAHITKLGPARSWSGFIWVNPPFGGRNGIAPWLARFFGDDIVGGVCLTPDRTSAPWWQLYAPRAGRILFVSPKIRFIDASGAEGKSPAQGTTLMSRGERGNRALENAARNGLGMLCVPQTTRPMVLAA